MRPSVFIVIITILFAACSQKYVTPGASVKISELADEDISKILSNKPSAEFPANIAIARIQDPFYSNYRHPCVRQTDNEEKKFSMMLTREPDEDEAFKKLSELEGVDQASPFNRLLLPYNYKSIKDLRLAAAKMKAHMLLVYTFDTEYSIDTKNYGPQNIFYLGYLKNKDVKVVTTASAALYDVQTEYLYGLSEATATANKKANAWKKIDEVDNLRVQTEKEAFRNLVGEVIKMWDGIVKEYKK